MLLCNASPYQKRFYIEWKINPKSITYNTVLIFEVHGSLNLQALNFALNNFIHQYDEGCRSYFIEENNTIKQAIMDNIAVDLEIQYLNESSDNLDHTKNQFIDNISTHVFDLQKPPLFKFGILFLKPTHVILVFNFHHIISDAITAGYFVNKISELYNAYQKHEVPINANLMSMAAYYEKQCYEQTSETLDYWENLLKDTEYHVDFPKIAYGNTNLKHYRSVYSGLSH